MPESNTHPQKFFRKPGLLRCSTTASCRAGKAKAAEVEKKVVVYTTSLRTIRKTHDDCRAVKATLRGLHVAVDERDVSMDFAYRREMLGLLAGRQLPLPQVFVGKTHLGGAEEVRQLNETGELTKLLEGVEKEVPGHICRACGGARFVPCHNCNGSRKLFDEEEEQLRRCSHCNENGLVKCFYC